MSDFQAIESVLDRAARRRRWERAWVGLWKGLLMGVIVGALTLLAFKIFPLDSKILMLAVLLMPGCACAGFAMRWIMRETRTETARWLDQHKGLKERLSTALEFSDGAHMFTWQKLLLTDAAKHARELDLRTLIPWKLPAASRWVLIVLLMAAGLGFAPEYRSKDHLQRQEDAEHIKDTARKLEELTKRQMEQRPLVQPATARAMDAVKDVAERLQTRPMTKPEAIKELASVSDKIKEQVQDLAKNPALKRMEKSAREQGGESGSARPEALQRKMDELQKALSDQLDSKKMDQFKRELEKLQQAASDMAKNGSNSESKDQMAQSMAGMAKQAEALGLDLPQLSEAMDALMGARVDQVLKELNAALTELDKMKQLAEQLQQLKSQVEKMGKDLAEQLEKGQAGAAKSTLEKMAQDLQKSGLTSEQMQKMVDEVAKSIDPAKDYGEVAEHLKKAVAQMRQAQKQQASQSLADAAKELGKIMGENQDMESLLAALDQLKGAQLCIGDGECLFGYCRGGNPKAGDKAKGGTGVGTWAENDQLSPDMINDFWDSNGLERPDADPRGHSDRDPTKPDNLAGTKVKGQMSPGGQMPSITLKGVHVKGESRVKFEEAAAAAQSDAQSALSQEKVPRAYQGAVRDYFDDLKK